VILVDELRHYSHSPVACRFGGRWCHMVSDTSEAELHDFAERIGMKRAWFQDRKRFPHYDLTAKRRAVAVFLGAVEVPSRELILRLEKTA
jgi:hypothetical protein